jgi:hypothetical protein
MAGKSFPQPIFPPYYIDYCQIYFYHTLFNIKKKFFFKKTKKPLQKFGPFTELWDCDCPRASKFIVETPDHPYLGNGRTVEEIHNFFSSKFEACSYPFRLILL